MSKLHSSVDLIISTRDVFLLLQDSWLYHLTVVSGGIPHVGTQYEQLIQKLMEIDGDPSKSILLVRNY